MKSKKLLSIIVLGILVVGLVSITGSKIKAQSNFFGKNEAMAQQLSSKLGIEENKVTVAMDEIRTEKQAERQQEFDNNLSQAVTDGKITEAQKQAILNKHSEMRANREKDREEYQNWLEKNSLDENELRDLGIGGMGFGKGVRGCSCGGF